MSACRPSETIPTFGFITQRSRLSPTRKLGRNGVVGSGAKILSGWSAIRKLRSFWPYLPSRGQRGAVSGTRKQTSYAFLFWRVRRYSGMITRWPGGSHLWLTDYAAKWIRANPTAPSADFLSRLSMRKVSNASERKSRGSISCKNQREEELLQSNAFLGPEVYELNADAIRPDRAEHSRA